MTACPMCRATDQAPGEQVQWADLWAAYEDEFQIEIPAAVKAAYQVGDSTTLGACRACGLRYFSPAVAGGPDFYELLDTRQGGYYNALTWEGGVVGSLIGDGDDVVDFGTGDGALLRALPRGRSGRTVGVDHNPSAIASLREAGIEGSADDFETFARSNPESFDVACAMQVLEHMADVAPLIQSCRDVLRPGGRMFIAVPNDSRDRERLEPLDCPPHHTTRWTEQDFDELAERFGLEVVAIRKEPEPPREPLRRAIERRLPGRLGWFASRVAIRLLGDRGSDRVVGRFWPDAPRDGFALLVELTTPTRP